MLPAPPPDKGHLRISRGFAVALIATSLITAASLAYLGRSSRASLHEILREPLPAPSPDMVATAKIIADQRRTAAQKREHEFGLVIANGEIQEFPGTPGNARTATLDKVVLAIRRLVSPAPQIKTIGGVGSLPLKNINLSWPSPSPDQLEAVLKALANSTGGQFTVSVERNEKVGRSFAVNNHGAAGTGILSAQSGTGPTYVLAPSAMAEANAPRRVAVFNIAALLPANLEANLADARTKLSKLRTDFGQRSPEVMALANEINQMERTGPNRVYVIENVLRETLRSLTPRALDTDIPILRYHQGTGLLVATGTDVELDVLGKIVAAMGGTAGSVLSVSGTPPQANSQPVGGNTQPSGQAPAARSATITVAADHKLRWNGQPFTMKDLPEKLRAFTQGAAPESLGVGFEIEGALTADTANFIKPLTDEIKKAGIANIVFNRKDLSGSQPPAAPPKP
jgi:biopolymer transport protein ExbD